MFSRRTILLQHPNGCRDSYIAPNQEFRMEFEVPQRDFPVTHALRIIGETDEFWKWRAECGNPYYLVESIEDALYRNELPNENFCLKMRGEGEAFERNAYMLLKKGTFLPGKPYRFSCMVRSENLRIDEGGEAVCELGIYRKKEGRADDDVYDFPDELVLLNAPQGSSPWQKLEKEFVMPADAVCLLVRIGFRKAHGEAAFGSPRLMTQGADSPIPPLDTPQTRFPEFNWLGENLDRRERPVFRISIDGQEVFYGEKYNAIYRRPDFTIAVPPQSAGKHTLTLRLEADYPTAVGFVLQGVDFLEEGAERFEVIAAPEFFPENTPCPILIRTAEDEVEISGTHFQGKGDHVLTLPPMKAGGNCTVELVSGDCRKQVVFKEIVAGALDGLRLSTSDAIFINQNPEDFLRYLEWYTSNRVGNALRFRCCYRWSGSRIYDEATWHKIIPFLNALNMDYVVQMDGRELPGKNGNPPEELVAGPHYLGRQAHENDGAFFYWGNSIWGHVEPPMPHLDILERSIDVGGIQPHIRPPRSNGRVWRFFDPTDAHDMKTASEKFVENLKKTQGQSIRHSGPSTLFRYFFQAGYRYLEAEQMYGPEEVILSALRGASRAYGKTEFGAHLATQWSSAPHNTPEHAERYWLSLCCCYMQGATQFNIEEGLWRMESGFVDYDRYSENCLRHLETHTRFRQFMETHRRRGKLVSPIGVVQGRYDGWSSFCRKNVWQREGAEWEFGDPEKSFDLLNTFFPRSRLQDIYVTPCTAEPHGWYTGMPYGSVDLFPIEGDWKRYKVVIFLGWNTFAPEDGVKMLDFVKQGGLLLLAAPHLSTEIKRNAALQFSSSPELNELLGENWQNAKEILRRNLGKGRVIFYPQEHFPAAFAKEYAADMKQLARQTVSEEYKQGWIDANEDVSFSAFDDEETGLRTIYLLNIRWWDRMSSSVKLHLDSSQYDIPVPYGQLFVLTIAGDCAVLPLHPLADVFGSPEQLSVQSPEQGIIRLFRKGKVQEIQCPDGMSHLNCIFQ